MIAVETNKYKTETILYGIVAIAICCWKQIEIGGTEKYYH